MSIEDLLNKLIANKVKLSVKEEKLLCHLPEDGIDKELLAQLKTHKEEIRKLIQQTTKSRLKKSPAILRTPGGTSGQLSHAQQRLWVIDHIEGSTHYNISNSLMLEGKLDVELFKKAFNTIIERHEILRSTYHLKEEGEVYQKVQPASPLDIPLFDLRGLSTEDQDKEVKRIQVEEGKLPFALEKDVMLRVKLLQVKEDAFVVLITIHHIATDGWSIGILIKEFSALYTAFCNEEKNPLSELDIQYSDYVRWQQEYLKGEALDALKNYWKNQLKDLPSVHRLPLDDRRPKTQTFAGNTLHSKIDAETSYNLKKICDSEGTTLFAGLYAAFTVLLARYSHERDIVVGTPIANREQTEVANLIGFFVNMLVLRSRMPQQINFIELIKQNKQMLIDAYSNQQMPFDMLVSELQPERNTKYSSLFQIMFLFQNNEKVEIKLPDLSLKQMLQNKPFALYDLSLTVDENNGNLFLSWEYKTKLFKESTIKEMARHFEQLLRSLVQTPLADVMKASMIDAEERELVLVKFNKTMQPYPSGNTVVELFQVQVQKNPDNKAIIYEGKFITYSELNKMSNQLANYLLTQYNIVQEDRVGIYLERNDWLIISLLAVLKTGAAYVPMDVNYPEERIRYIQQDCSCKITIDEVLLKAFQATEKVPSEEPLVKISPTHLAYVIYTSGSTGQPKGVMITHNNAVSFLANVEERLHFKGLNIVAATTNVTFDISFLEIFGTLCTGRQMVLFSAEELMSNDLFISKLKKEEAEILQVTPSRFNLLDTEAVKNQLPHLRLLLIGGEAFPINVFEEKDFYEGITILNVYGPTEATIWSACSDIKSGEYLTVGRPLANEQIYILSEGLELNGLGVIGEICIGGEGVARGYLNQPELTKKHFIDNPFVEGSRLYRTGDLGRWLLDGTLECIGRIDGQVKVNGNRVELGEIEHAILNCKGDISQVVVAIHEFENNNMLVAYIVAKEPFDKKELIALLRAKLPYYMIPHHFIALDYIPLTVNGKLDKKLLPSIDESELLINEYKAPVNDIEKALVNIWQDVLKVEKIGVSDNFFALGGNSIAAVKIFSRIEHELKIKLDLLSLFSKPIIEELALEIINSSWQITAVEEGKVTDRVTI